MGPFQLDLLAGSPMPAGFEYRAGLITEQQEAALIEHFQCLELKEFDFHGFRGLRRVRSFGVHYDFSAASLRPAGDMPAILLPVKVAASAIFAGLEASSLVHALVTEYRPGVGIGWHKDRSVFGDVIGVSLGSACRLRFRQEAPSGWRRASMMLQPRSAYLLRGEARHDWQHSISPMATLRYSITFRTVLRGMPPA